MKFKGISASVLSVVIITFLCRNILFVSAQSNSEEKPYIERVKELDKYITYYYPDQDFKDGTATAFEKATEQLIDEDRALSYKLRSDDLGDFLDKEPALFDKVTQAMVAQADKYSHYMSGDKHSVSYPENDYVGVGLSCYSGYKYGFVVKNVVMDSPAEKAGILTDDIISWIDNRYVSLLPSGEVTSLLQGNVGTDVSVGVLRGGERLDFNMKRAAVATPAVFYEYNGNTAVITIKSFSSPSYAQEFAKYYKQAVNDINIQNVIIDVRDNPGGLVDVCADMLDAVITQKDVKMFELPGNHKTSTYISHGVNTWKPDRLTVLTNEKSASCAEIFAGTLQELGLADVVGQTTRGKGRAQFHINVSNNYVVVITFSIIEIAKGKVYDGVGIVPDYAVTQSGSTDFFSKGQLKDLPVRGFYISDKLHKKLPEIYAIQQRLSLLGVLPGKVDGVLDLRTLWAINQYRKSVHIQTNDEYIGTTALTKLKADCDKIGNNKKVAADSQMNYAMSLMKTTLAKAA